MIEEWRAVVGYEDRYEVSSLGYVKSLPKVVHWPNRSGFICTRYHPERILASKVASRGGYAVIGLCDPAKPDKIKQFRVHRLVLEAFVGPCPTEMEARHLNGDRMDNRLENLRWGTKSENAYDKIRHGTHTKTSRTHCPRRHPLADPNLEPSQVPFNRRACWSCALTRGAPASLRSRSFQEVSDEYYAKLMSGWRPDQHAVRTSKIGPDEVRQIRMRAEAGESRKVLAAEFGLSGTQIRRIILRERWTSVD